MPFVVVTAPALHRSEDTYRALGGVATATADALGLAECDVVVSLAAATYAVRGSLPSHPWPVVVLHGRDRGPEASERARTAVAQAVSAGWGVAIEQIHVEWSREPA